MTVRRTVALALALAALAPLPALALPRFAARNGMECIQCHLNPSGGGIRNEYGAAVFAQTFLPMSASGEPASWTDATLPPEEAPARTAGKFSLFRGAVTEWLSIGGDFRAAYLQIRPELGPTPGDEPQITSSFFLMQADLYHAVKVTEPLTLYLDVGVYSGFEAWALWDLSRGSEYDLLVKVGRFLPAFGIREVEHQLYTREGVGLGAVDRDTGIELTGYAGPFTAQLALVNGTLGDTGFDTTGKERESFEKALVARLAGRVILGPVRTQLGLSGSFNDNASQPNPLFGAALGPSASTPAADGVDELRGGAFLTANLGRVTYLGDLVFVRDSFTNEEVARIEGYSSYQELSFVLVQGLELIGTVEYQEPDLEVLHDRSLRRGLVLEYFPWPSLELRTMVRRTVSDTSPTGGAWDLVAFAHVYF